MVQAFAPHAADQAFHIRILPRAPWRRDDLFHAHRRHGRAERLPVCVQARPMRKAFRPGYKANQPSIRPTRKASSPCSKPNQFLRLTASALIREATASDSGGPGAAGGGATGGRRRTRAQARPGPQPQGGAALQARLWRTRPEGAEQLHRHREPDHEDQYGGVPAVLQRTDGGGWGALDHCRNACRCAGHRPGPDDGVV